MSETNEVVNLKELLLKSNWPKCDGIAGELYIIGTEEARLALIDGLRGKRHHIRTASIKALAKFQDISFVEYIRPLLTDASYETRMQAIESIKELTGEDFSIEKQG